MPKFGTVPPEVPVQRSLDVVAPAFAQAVWAMMLDLAGGLNEMVFETLRTPERQAFLYGFGRSYDDGRGKVTNAKTSLYSWHGFGLAVDVVEKDGTPWDAPVEFWAGIGKAAARAGLVWGGKWTRPDLPHVQWGTCPTSPSDIDRALVKRDGMRAIWHKYGADRCQETSPIIR